MAGIAASRYLFDRDVHSIVLEARDRIGGRASVDHSLSAPVQMGATWIHGIHGNPMTELADSLGTTYTETDFCNESGKALLAYDSMGRLLPMDRYTKGMDEGEGIIAKARASILSRWDTARDPSLESYLTAAVPDLYRCDSPEAYGRYFRAKVFQEYINSVGANELDFVQTAREHIYLPGGDFVVDKLGYPGMLERLTEGLDVRLETMVQAIDYRSDDIKVITSGGTYSCDHCIVTLPLGVLKSGSVQFDPDLSRLKKDSIQRMGFGVYEKLVMEFDKFRWPRAIQRFNYIPDRASRHEPLCSVWLNWGYYCGKPIIMTYNKGRGATTLNQLSDEDLLERALGVMGKIFRTSGFGAGIRPLRYVRTSWEADPFSRGSVSFNRLGQHTSDRQQLAESINGRVHFAGEACHPHFFASMHGAYETGVGIACKIVAREGGQ